MFIYFVTNSVNGKQYVGQTRRKVGYRWRAHVSEARRKTKPACPLFHRAILKYGPDSFKVDFIKVTGESQEWINFLERWYIEELKTIKPSGYNVEPGGRGGFHAEETKRKIGMAHLGMKRSEQAKQNMSAWQKGKCHRSPEMIKKTALAIVGRRHSPESRGKMRESALAHWAANPRPRGYRNGPLSEETKRKLSEARKGQKPSEEQKRKVSSTMQNLWRSPEYRSKVMAARVGRHYISEAGIERLRESKREYWRKLREAKASG